MPSERFYKLKAEKQERLCAAALQEFIAYKDNYANASVNRIAKATGISIGSLYTYFENKDDLFCYVYSVYSRPHNLHLQTDSLMDFAKERIVLNSDTATYTEVQKILKAIAIQSAHDSDLFFRLLTGPANNKLSEQIRECISNDQKQGRLRENIDPKLIEFLYLMMDYLAQKYRLEVEGGERGNESVFEESELSYAISDILFHGIYKKETD